MKYQHRDGIRKDIEMAIVFDEATKEDIDELIRMRIAYMIDNFGSVSDRERAAMEAQLPDYFETRNGADRVCCKRCGQDRFRCLSSHY